MKLTSGEWVVKKDKINGLPDIHVMSGSIYLCSVHQTNQTGARGEEKHNAYVFSAAKDMYEAIVIGLTGADLEGKPVSQEEAFIRLQKARAKAEGKANDTKTTK
jgi:hypothetical protein